MPKTQTYPQATPKQRAEALYLNDHGMPARRIGEVLNINAATAFYNWRAAASKKSFVPPELSPDELAVLDGLLIADGLKAAEKGGVPEAPSNGNGNHEEPGTQLALAGDVEPNGHEVVTAPVNGDEQSGEVIDLGAIRVSMTDVLARASMADAMADQLTAAREEVAQLKGELSMAGGEYARQIADRDDEIKRLERQVAGLKADVGTIEKTLHLTLKGKYE